MAYCLFADSPTNLHVCTGRESCVRRAFTLPARAAHPPARDAEGCASLDRRASPRLHGMPAPTATARPLARVLTPHSLSLHCMARQRSRADGRWRICGDPSLTRVSVSQCAAPASAPQRCGGRRGAACAGAASACRGERLRADVRPQGQGLRQGAAEARGPAATHSPVLGSQPCSNGAPWHRGGSLRWQHTWQLLQHRARSCRKQLRQRLVPHLLQPALLGCPLLAPVAEPPRCTRQLRVLLDVHVITARDAAFCSVCTT